MVEPLTIAAIAAAAGAAGKIVGATKRRKLKSKERRLARHAAWLEQQERMARIRDATASQTRQIENLGTQHRLQKKGETAFLIAKGMFGGPAARRRQKLLANYQTSQKAEAQQNLDAIRRGETLAVKRYAIVKKGERLAKQTATLAYREAIAQAVAGTVAGVAQAGQATNASSQAVSSQPYIVRKRPAI